jgi:hypothetical protein
MIARLSARALLACVLLVHTADSSVSSVLDSITLIQDGMQATLGNFEEMYDKFDLRQADSNWTAQGNDTAAPAELSFDKPARISMHVDVIMIGLDNLEGSAAQHIEHTVLEHWFDHLIGKVPHSSLLGKQAAAASAHVEYDYQYHIVDAGLQAAGALQNVMQLHLRQQAAKLYISTWHMEAALTSLKQTLEGIHADTDHPAAAFTLFVLNPVRSALVPDSAVYGYR